MKTIDQLRILEIGQFCLFKRTLPAQTTLVYTGESLSRVQGLDAMVFGVGMIPWLRRGLSSGRWDVVVCHCPVHPAWDTRHGVLRGMRHLVRRLAKVRTLGTHVLGGTIASPLVMLDFNDEPTIPHHVFPLLERCTVYFKRELPADFAKAFLGSAPEMRNHGLAYSSQFFSRNVHKLRPISIAVPESTARLASSIACPKTTDVCFFGSINSTIRRQGLAVLESLRAQGYAIDVALGGVSGREYFERCAASWLTLSPEGYGWECFRHYEASLCRSVPVMNFPGICRHQPLVDRVHGFLYPIEGDGLRQTLVTALSDKAVLRTMAAEAARHVLAHHTHARIVEHILAAVLGDTGPVQQPL